VICSECRGVVLSQKEQCQRSYRRRSATTVVGYTRWNICDGCHRKEIESGAEEVRDEAQGRR
jgi:hypothetical protein